MTRQLTTARLATESPRDSGQTSLDTDTEADAASRRAARRGIGIGAMFFAGFGTLWIGLGSHAAGASTTVLIAIAALGLTLFGLGWRRSRETRLGQFAGDDAPAFIRDQEARQRVFRRINGAQYIAIVAVVTVLNVLGKPEWIGDGIILIVGLHFFPLARLFRSPGHGIVGAALIAIVAAVVLFSRATPDIPAAPIATGLVLWAGAAYGLVRSMRNRDARRVMYGHQ